MADSNESTTTPDTVDASAINRETTAVNDDTRGDLIRRIRARVTGQLVTYGLLTAIGVVALLYVVFGKKIEGNPEAVLTMWSVIGITVVGMGISALAQREKPAVVGWLVGSLAVAIFMFLGVVSKLSLGLAAVLLGSYTFQEVGLSGFLTQIPMWLYVTLIVIFTILAIVLYVRSVIKANKVETADTKPLRVVAYVIILIVLGGLFLIVASGFVLAVFDVVVGVAVMAALVLIAPPALLAMMIMRPQNIVTNVIAAFFMSFGMTVAIGLSIMLYRGL